MEDITAIFKHYITQCDSIDIAESEFKMALHDDPEMKQAYREWCREVGSTEKNGFLDYCHEFMDSQDEVWNSLNDFDE